MGSITYYVTLGFARNEEGELVALEPVESQSPGAAIAKARTLAEKNAGAVAFLRSGDPNVGDFEDARVLWQGGAVPADLV